MSVVVVQLEHAAGAHKGRVWMLEIAGEQALLRDDAGELRNAFTPADAAREWVMPGFVDGNPLTIPTGDGAAAFHCGRRGIAHLRAFMRIGAVEAGPAALRAAWIRAAGEFALGCVLAGVGIAGTVASYSASSSGNVTIYYGVVLFGLIEIGRGAFLLRECALRAKERRRRSFGAFATPTAAPTRVPAEIETVAVPRSSGRRSPVGMFILIVGGSLALLFAGAVVVAVVGRGLRPAPAPPNPVTHAGTSPTPPAPPSTRETSTPAPEEVAPRPATTNAKPAEPNVDTKVEVVAVDGEVELIEPPSSVLPGALVSSSLARVFAEADARALSVELVCDSTSPGTLKAGSPGEQGSIPPGERVASYFLHANTFGGEVADLEGAVTFSADVLGVILSSDLLDASDGAMGGEDVRYPSGGRWRGWLDGDTADWVTISDDRRTVSFRSSTGRWVDQIRVVVRAP